jgi:2-polyprenyl-6-hydroxyphenyl methylase/3-demethylubiquinone-9 3-methyltransferase
MPVSNAIEAAPRKAGSVDAQEIERFASQADAWWNPTGGFRELHRLNPPRLRFIRSQLVGHFGRQPGMMQPFAGLRLLDIGCGGGLVAEPMARLGCAVTGIDASREAIAAARAHGEAAGLTIDYRTSTVESLAEQGERFDAVVALELIEHLAEQHIFFRSVGEVVRPGGVFIAATLNRTAKSFALAIVGAEYLLRWLPRGTHDWRRFVRPAELAGHLRRHGMHLTRIAGIGFDTRTGEWSLGADLAINYIAIGVRS